MASLPQTPGAWRTAYGNGCSIHDFQTVSSASKMAQEQFFALKVIWPNHTTDDLTKQWIRRFGSSEKELFQKAESLKQDDKAWGWYLGALAANIERPQSWKIDSKIPRECGTYTLAFHSQLEVSTLPNNSGPDADKVFVTPMVTRRKVRYPEESPSLRAEKRWGQMEREPSTPRLSSPSPRSSEDSVPAEIGYSMGSVFQPSPKALLDPPTQDEETVNRALMNFLDAHHLHDERNSDWSSTRKEFVFQSAKHTTDEDQSGNEPKARSKQSGKKAKAKAREKDKEGRKPVRFVARTDGHLKVYGSPEMSAAILEVKARQRPRPPKPGDFTIEMQESAQMALWIFQEPQSHWTAAQATGATSPQDISYQ